MRGDAAHRCAVTAAVGHRQPTALPCMCTAHASIVRIAAGDLPPHWHVQFHVSISDKSGVIGLVAVQRGVNDAAFALKERDNMGRCAAERLTITQLTSHPAEATASRSNAAISDAAWYPASSALATSQSAALTSAAAKPAALTSAQLHPAALKLATSQPAALRDGRSNPATFKRTSLQHAPTALATALTAATLFKLNNLRVRAAVAAMLSREEADVAVLATRMTRTQRWRVASSAAARHTSFAPCNPQRHTHARHSKDEQQGDQDLASSSKRDLKGKRLTFNRAAAFSGFATCKHHMRLRRRRRWQHL